MSNYNLGTAEGKIVVDSSGVATGVAGANASLGKLGKGGGFNAAQFGQAMTFGVTAPIVAVGAVALKTAIDFESAFSDVVKTVDGTESELADLRTGIIDMANETPAAREEIAGVAAAAGQLGVAVGDVEAFTETMIELGVSTNLTAEDAATNIARIQNIMGSGVDTVDNFGSALVDLGNNSATTEADILNMTNRLAGIANQTDISEASMLGIAAAMSSVGIRAEAGGTAMTKTLKDFDSWTREAVGAAEESEEAWNKFLDSGDPAADFFNLMDVGLSDLENMAGDEALLRFVGQMQEFEGEGGNMIALLEELEITEIRQSDSLLKLIGSGDLLGESITRGNVAWEENNALQEETAKKYATTASKLKIAKNNATNVARILGEALIPVVLDLTSVMVPVAEAFGAVAKLFGGLPEPVRKVAAGFALLLAAIGPSIFVGSKLIGLFKQLKLAFIGLNAVMAANPFVLIVLAVIALVAAFYLLYTRSETFRNFINNLGKNIKEIWGKVLDFFKDLPKQFKKLWGKVEDIFGEVKGWLAKAYKEFTEFFKKLPKLIARWTKKVIKKVVKFGLNFVKEMIKFPLRIPGLMAYALGLVIGSFVRFHIALIKKVTKLGTAFIDKMVSWLTRLPGLIWDWGQKLLTRWIEIQLLVINEVIRWGGMVISKFIQIGLDLVLGIINAIIGLPGKFAGVVGDVISKFPGWAADFLGGAIEIGANFINGIIDIVKGLPGQIYSWVLSAINGLGDLGEKAYNKLKGIGESMWNGFKKGLFGSPKTKVEYAVLGMTAAVDDSIGTLGSQLRSLHNLSRSIPGVGDTAGPGAAGLASASLVSAGAQGGGAAVEHHYHAPLVGEAEITDRRDIYDLANDLEYEQTRRNRGKGTG